MTSTLAVAVLLLTQAADGNSAESLYSKLTERIKAAKTLSGVIEGEAMGQKLRLTFKAMKPSYLVMKWSEAELYMNGDKGVMYDPKSKTYQNVPSPAMGGVMTMLFGLTSFLGETPMPVKPANLKKVTVDGKELDSIDLVPQSGGGGLTKITLLLSPENGLPVSWSIGDGQQQMKMAYSDIVLDAPMTVEEFAFKAPEGAKEREQPASPQFDTLKKGVKAPTFSLKTPEGKAVALNAASMKKKKATIVNFWFYG